MPSAGKPRTSWYCSLNTFWIRVVKSSALRWPHRSRIRQVPPRSTTVCPELVRFPSVLELAGRDLDLAEQRQPLDRLPGERAVVAVVRLARQRPAGVEVLGVGVGVVEGGDEVVEDDDLRDELDALARWPGRCCAVVANGNVASGTQHAIRLSNLLWKYVTPSVMRSPHSFWSTPTSHENDVSGVRLRIREAREEQVVEGRRPEAAAGAAVQARCPTPSSRRRASPARWSTCRSCCCPPPARRRP